MLVARMALWHFVDVFEASIIYSPVCCDWSPGHLMVKFERSSFTVQRLGDLIGYNLKSSIMGFLAFHDMISSVVENGLVCVLVV